jgi:hypothetical protein
MLTFYGRSGKKWEGRVVFPTVPPFLERFKASVLCKIIYLNNNSRQCRNLNNNYGYSSRNFKTSSPDKKLLMT